MGVGSPQTRIPVRARFGYAGRKGVQRSRMPTPRAARSLTLAFRWKLRTAQYGLHRRCCVEGSTGALDHSRVPDQIAMDSSVNAVAMRSARRTSVASS
jgi:hypothetical protein